MFKLRGERVETCVGVGREGKYLADAAVRDGDKTRPGSRYA